MIALILRSSLKCSKYKESIHLIVFLKLFKKFYCVNVDELFAFFRTLKKLRPFVTFWRLKFAKKRGIWNLQFLNARWRHAAFKKWFCEIQNFKFQISIHHYFALFLQTKKEMDWIRHWNNGTFVNFLFARTKT